MKTIKFHGKLMWDFYGNKEYSTTLGDYGAIIIGKYYHIDLIDNKGNILENVFQAKARSNADALQRATNKLVKFTINSV